MNGLLALLSFKRIREEKRIIYQSERIVENYTKKALFHGGHIKLVVLVITSLFLLSSISMAALIPHDEFFEVQWQINNDPNLPGSLNLPEAWETETGRSPVVVAVIDSGVAIDDACLRDHIWTNPLEWRGSFDHSEPVYPEGTDEEGFDDNDPPGLDDVDDDDDGNKDFTDNQVLNADYNYNGDTINDGDTEDIRLARFDEDESGDARPGYDDIDDDMDGKSDWSDDEVREADYNNDGNMIFGEDKQPGGTGVNADDLEDIVLSYLDDDENGFVDDIHGWNFADNDNNVRPTDGIAGKFHGTYISCIIAGDMNDYYEKGGTVKNYFKDTGIAQITILPIKIFYGNSFVGAGVGGGGLENLAKGVDYAVEMGADIISLSYGSEIKDDEENPQDSEDAIAAMENAYEHGILIVSAAGNYRFPFMVHMNPTHTLDDFIPNSERDITTLEFDEDFEDFNNYRNNPQTWPGFTNGHFSIDETYQVDGNAYHELIEMDIDTNEIDKVIFPSNLEFVMTVGASNRYGNRCSYSFFESDKIDVIAPSGDIALTQNQWKSESEYGSIPDGEGNYVDLTRYPIQGLQVWDACNSEGLVGTSYACPHVSALAALLWAINPNFNHQEIWNIITASADDVTSEKYEAAGNMEGYDKYTGWGRINPERAVEYARLHLDDDNFETPIQLTRNDESPPTILKGHSMDIDNLGCTQYVYSSNADDALVNNPNGFQKIRYEVIDRNGVVMDTAYPCINPNQNSDAEDPFVFVEHGIMSDVQQVHVIWRGDINPPVQKGDIYYRLLIDRGSIVIPEDPPAGTGPFKITNDANLEEGPPKIVHTNSGPQTAFIAYPQKDGQGNWDIYGCEIRDMVPQARFPLCDAVGDQTNVILGLYKDALDNFCVNIVWEDARGGAYYAVWDMTNHQFLFETGNNGKQLFAGACTHLAMATEYDAFSAINGIYGVMHLAWVDNNDIFYRRSYIDNNQVKDQVEKVQVYQYAFDPLDPNDDTPFEGHVPIDLFIDYDQFGRSHLVWASNINNFPPQYPGVFYTAIGTNGKPSTLAGHSQLLHLTDPNALDVEFPIVKVDHDIKENSDHSPYFGTDGHARVAWIITNPGGEYGRGEYTTSRPIWSLDNDVMSSTQDFEFTDHYDFIVDDEGWKMLVVRVWTDEDPTDKYHLYQYAWHPSKTVPTLNNYDHLVEICWGYMYECYQYPRIISCYDEERYETFFYVTWLTWDSMEHWDMHLVATTHSGLAGDDYWYMSSGFFLDAVQSAHYDIAVGDVSHNLGYTQRSEDTEQYTTRAKDTDEFIVSVIKHGVQGYQYDPVTEDWDEVEGPYVSIVSTRYHIDDNGPDYWEDGPQYDVRPNEENPAEPYFGWPDCPRIEVDTVLRKADEEDARPVPTVEPHLVLVECPGEGATYGDIWYVHHIDQETGDCGRQQISTDETAYYPDFVLERDLYPRYAAKYYHPRTHYIDDNREDHVVHIVWRVEEVTHSTYVDFNINYAKVRYFWGYNYNNNKKVLNPFEITERKNLINREDLLLRGYTLEELLNSEMGPPDIENDFENNLHITVATDLFSIYTMRDGQDNDYTRCIHYILLDHAGDMLVTEEQISWIEGNHPIIAIEMMPTGTAGIYKNIVNAIVMWSVESFDPSCIDFKFSRHSMFDRSTYSLEQRWEIR